MMIKKHSFIDLFCGIGAFRMGFNHPDFQCVFSSEINTECQNVYFDNFNDRPYGDITTLDINNIPNFEILLAGFPCQPFSISGKKKGFEDARGTLFFNICEIISIKKPKVVVLENVKNLIHHDHGNTIKVILNSLSELGYTVNHQILNANDFSVPQSRERIIIVATRSGEQHFNFDNIKKEKSENLNVFLDDIDSDFFFLDEGYTLIGNSKKQPSGLIFSGYLNKNKRKKGVLENTEHLSRVHSQPNRIYSSSGYHPTLSAQETSGRYYILDERIGRVRRLTLQECYKIMGFPVDFKTSNIKTQAYKQIGNSICVPMIKSISEEILNIIT